jgi:hypothetical protein
MRGCRDTLGARQRVRRRDRAVEQVRPEQPRHLVQRHMPGREHDAELSAAESHDRIAAPLRREKFRLAGKFITDLGERRLADRPGDDAGKFPRLATVRRALHRRPSHQRTLAVRLAGHRGKLLQPRLAIFAPAAGNDANHEAGPITATPAASSGMIREPARDDLRADAGRIAAGDG